MENYFLKTSSGAKCFKRCGKDRLLVLLLVILLQKLLLLIFGKFSQLVFLKTYLRDISIPACFQKLIFRRSFQTERHLSATER